MRGHTITASCVVLMPDRLHVFQIVLLSVFGLLALAGMFFLATTKGKNAATVSKVNVVIWGPPFGEARIDAAIANLAESDPVFKGVTYVPKNPSTLYGDLVETIATAGAAPDLVVLDETGLLALKNKLYPLSYEEVYPLRTFRDSFVEGGEVFALQDGVYALPVLVDPLVLYWNRDLFTNAVVAQVPQDWGAFVRYIPRLTAVDGSANITRSGVALGEYDNVLHATKVMSALLMQTGTPIVSYADGRFRSALVGSVADKPMRPNVAVEFYTTFSNPTKLVYSWNKTFGEDRAAFAANRTALYFGMASEVPILKKLNPNLNFDVTLFPQPTNGTHKLTYGTFYGVALLGVSEHKNDALRVMYALSGANAAPLLTKTTGLPSARRDILSEDPTNPLSSTMARSAIMARTWPMPSRSEVNGVFSRLINNTVSGKQSADAGLTTASNELDALLKRYDAR